MKAYDTQKWLLYALLLPLALLNGAWWIIQLYIYSERCLDAPSNRRPQRQPTRGE